MGGKSKPWTGCHACGAWLYNWRLERQRGFCGCGQWLEPYPKASPVAAAASRPNFNNHKDKEKQFEELLALLPDSDLKLAIGKLVAVRGGQTDPKATDPYKQFQNARAMEQQKKQQVERAAKLHAEAVQSVADRQQALEAATADCIVAERAAAEALAEYNSSMGLEVGKADAKDDAVKFLGFDRRMFDEADEYPEEVANEVRKTKSEVEAAVTIIENRRKELEAMVAGCQQKMDQATKKRKGGNGEAQDSSTPVASSASAAGGSSSPGNDGGNKEKKRRSEGRVRARLQGASGKREAGCSQGPRGQESEAGRCRPHSGRGCQDGWWC